MKYSATLSALLFLCWLGAAPQLSAQVGTPSASGDEESATPAPEQVIIEREAMKLIDPKVYQVPLQILPSKFISVVSPSTGVVSKFDVKTGDRLSARAELFRLNDDAQELVVKRAEAQVALHQLRVDQGKKKGDADATAVAVAELKVAQVELEIANARLNATIIRAEEATEVFRTYAVTGELVSLYQKMVDIGDPSTMTVEIPVNRSDVKQDGTVSIKIEDQDVEAKVVSVLPPTEAFEPLRALYDSLASARLEIANRDRKWKTGQAVYVSTIPREIVVEVPNASIISAEEGQRKVQIIRKHVVRDIQVKVLAPVGADRSFLTGKFQAGDELVLTTSMPLEDGTQLSPKVTDEQGAGQPTTPLPKAGGF